MLNLEKKGKILNCAIGSVYMFIFGMLSLPFFSGLANGNAFAHRVEKFVGDDKVIF